MILAVELVSVKCADPIAFNAPLILTKLFLDMKVELSAATRDPNEEILKVLELNAFIAEY